jgi:serine/threonine protein kinase
MYAAGVVLFRLIFKSYPLSSIEMKKQLVENQGKERIELKFPHNDVESFIESPHNVRGIESSKLSDDLKDLLNRLLSHHPDERPSAQQIFEHPWFIKKIEAFSSNQQNLVKDTQVLIAHRLKYVCSLSTVKIIKEQEDKTKTDIKEIIQKIGEMELK